jgi:hypothetical protein
MSDCAWVSFLHTCICGATQLGAVCVCVHMCPSEGISVLMMSYVAMCLCALEVISVCMYMYVYKHLCCVLSPGALTTVLGTLVNVSVCIVCVAPIHRRNPGGYLQPSHFTDGEIKAQRSGQGFALQSWASTIPPGTSVSSSLKWG